MSKLREAFEAGREYHDPGHRSPILRWNTFESWIKGLETYTEYGVTKERKADATNRTVQASE